MAVLLPHAALAQHRLEIPPGDLTRLGLRVGQVIELPRESLDALAR